MSALCVDLPVYLSGLERNVQASRSALSMHAAAIDLLCNAVVSCLPQSSCHWNLHMRIKKCAMDVHTTASGFRNQHASSLSTVPFLHAHQHQLLQKVDV